MPLMAQNRPFHFINSKENNSSVIYTIKYNLFDDSDTCFNINTAENNKQL